jgi:hypothetical protein
MWPTGSQAVVAATIGGLAALALRRSRPTRPGDIIGPAALEFAFVAALYSIWRMAKNLPLARARGAVDRADGVVALATGRAERCPAARCRRRSTPCSRR